MSSPMLERKADPTLTDKDGVEVQISDQEVVEATKNPFTTKGFLTSSAKALYKYGRFFGPGLIISVAYIDPDNLQTNVTAGAQFGYKLLFMIFVSNAIAVFLQALSTKLGCVTGLNLSQMSRAFLPSWLNICLWIMAEASIICTDISQVIGTATAINLLIPKIPLAGAAAISIADTLFILLFYRQDGSLRRLRLFEAFVSMFVIAIFVMFCIELSLISPPPREVFRGFLPSRGIFVSDGLYASCAILGGTLMPHTLYLGSGLVQARMRDVDKLHNRLHEVRASESKYAVMLYRPTLSTIRQCMNLTIVELCITLFVVAIFVNSANLIIAGASFTPDAQNADLQGLHQLFVDTLGKASGYMFALSLLFSGISAGIVATLAGQMICEGAMNWRIRPFFRRLATRMISIIPAMIIAASLGQEGLAKAFLGCNVVLSIALIFLTFPLVYFTSHKKFMSVRVDDREEPVGVVDGILTYATGRAIWAAGGDLEGTVSLANNWATTIAGWVIWFIIAAMNVAALTFIGLGIGSD